MKFTNDMRPDWSDHKSRHDRLALPRYGEVSCGDVLRLILWTGLLSFIAGIVSGYFGIF
ncbi:hypothetical protein [Amorphus orientalis]|uniref:Uncharacterized protein n=1 Tax=Amorphus orientalis TaxID=649198 RepID=A0AAE4ASL0_9HYPH|nr:hypothetical protein [Amorphus orientalis]MDQ0316391.1 hypothetical protein [Amorphus orientalis]